MIAVISNKTIVLNNRLQLEGKVIIESTSLNPVGTGYNIGIVDYALYQEEYTIVEDQFEEDPETGELIQLDPIERKEVRDRLENLGTKNIYIEGTTIDYLYSLIDPEVLETLSYSMKDRVSRQYAVLAYVQSDLLEDGTGRTVYGLQPEDWIIYEKQ